MGFFIATLLVFFILLVITHVWDGYWNWAVEENVSIFGGKSRILFNLLGYAGMALVSVSIVALAPFLWILALFAVAAVVMNGFARKIAAKIRALLARIER